MKLTDYRKPITTWLQLSDSRNNSFNWGELMFSLSYLPTAERLTVVVVKARNLKASTNEDNVQKAADQNYDIQNVFVKVRRINWLDLETCLSDGSWNGINNEICGKTLGY